MLVKRIITGIILIILLIAAVFYFPRPLVALVIALLLGTGLWEFYTLCENKALNPCKIFGIISGITISVLVYTVLAYNLIKIDVNELILIILFISLAVILIKYAFKKDGSSVIINGSVTLLGILYVSFLFTFIIKLRFITNSDRGMGWVMSLFIITKISDISAFFIGSKWGRHKLIPRISAKKSIEGAIASVAGALLVSLLLKLSFLQELSWVMVSVLGILLGGIGQVGDLVESLMKRDAQIKDSGKFVPGLGGVLDFMDSLLFTAPVMYIFFLCIKPVLQNVS